MMTSSDQESVDGSDYSIMKPLTLTLRPLPRTAIPNKVQPQSRKASYTYGESSYCPSHPPKSVTVVIN